MMLFGRTTSTHTLAVLEVSAAAFEEIEAKLRKAGYDHAFDKDDEHGTTIDMSGIMLAREKPTCHDPKPPNRQPVNWCTVCGALSTFGEPYQMPKGTR